MRAFLMPSRARSHFRDASAKGRRRQRDGTCRRTRPGMNDGWSVPWCEGPNLDVPGQSALDQHRGDSRTSASMRCMHFDDMVEGEQRERDPYRRGRGGADFEHGDSDDPERQDYLQVDRVVRGDPDLAVTVLEEIHDRAGALRMAGQELGLF